jgi:ATP-binding cassette subfamily B protein
MSEKFNILQSAMASSERIFTLLDTPVKTQSPTKPILRPAPAKGRIEFDGVWFAYGDDNYVLRDVSFVVEPGERIGIVGATGAGKTTIINLLMRFYDVSRGRILVDGIDVRELSLSDLRGLSSLVLQDAHLFAGSIAANVRLGDQTITDAEIHAAITSVHAKPFIDQLPAGLASPVAERGATLSVGQKQLLTFARALVYEPRVLVLDEATSIAIAHRLSTIQDMDRILVLHKGQLREAGTHQELLARRGIYYKLYQLQYQEQEIAAAG